MPNAGLISSSRNTDSVIYALIDRSERFEKVRPGEYRLLGVQEDLTREVN